MAERVHIRYKRLFEVRVLHHYWLDEGQTLFDSLPEENISKRLQTYDKATFLSVAPTATTEKLLQEFQGVFKNTALSFLVAVPEAVLIRNDVVFEFIITVENAGFYNYTALTLREQKIHEIYYQPEDKIYRYKENVFVLSNLTGIPRGTGASKSLFLSKPIPTLAPDDKVESLVLSGSALLQLTSDQPGATTQQLHVQANSMPVFVHQGDVPAVVPPAGLVGAPDRGVLLSGDIPDNTFALVRIAAQKPGDADYSCTENKRAKEICPVFQIRFKNRSTIWKYYNKNTGAPVSTQPAPLPLTNYGNAGTKQKPSEGIKVTFDNSITTKIKEVFSEVFE